MKLLPSNYNGVVVAGDENDKYIKENQYFIFKDNEVIRIKPKKKVIYKLMSDKEQSIKEYISQNNLKLKKETDLIKIFNYYNSL